MIGKFCYQNFKAVGPIQAELHILKVEKLDACIRPLFANLVTFVDQDQNVLLRLHLALTKLLKMQCIVTMRHSH